MTPFHPDIENDAGHTIDQDDLIAFHLHELSSPEERAVRRVLHTNPALQSESLAIASTLRAFPKHEAPLPLDAAALDRHWLAIRNSLPVHVPPAVAPRSFFTRWALPTLAASALAATALILSLHHNPHTAPATTATTTPPPVAPTTASSVPSATSIPTSAPVHPYRSVPPNSIVAELFLKAPSPQAASSIPSNPPQAQPVPNQPIPKPITAAPSAAASPASTSIATNQQPTSATPSSPTAPTNARPFSRAHHNHTTDITLAVIGNLTPDRSFTSTTGTGASGTASYTQETTPSVGALASFHQQLRPWLGYRITADYSEPTFQYIYQASGIGTSGNIIHQHVYELSGTYVVDGPRHRRISTSAEAGAGMLAFRPADSNQSPLPLGNAFRPVGAFGISAEYTLSKHLAIHAGYRGLLYKAPTAYATYGTTIPPAPNNLTLSNEPVIGLTYRFRPTREE